MAETDEALLRELVATACAEVLPTCGLNIQQQEDIKKLCEESTERIAELHACSGADTAGSSAQPHEAEQVLELYRQVRAGTKGVRTLRRDVLMELSAEMACELSDARPLMPAFGCVQSGHASGVATPVMARHSSLPPGSPLSIQRVLSSPLALQRVLSGSGSGGGGEAAPESDAWRVLNEMGGRVPSLLARMEHALARLTRSVAVTEGEVGRPSPRTMEKVLLGRAAGGGGDADADVEQEGADATRRALVAWLAV